MQMCDARDVRAVYDTNTHAPLTYHEIGCGNAGALRQIESMCLPHLTAVVCSIEYIC